MRPAAGGGAPAECSGIFVLCFRARSSGALVARCLSARRLFPPVLAAAVPAGPAVPVPCRSQNNTNNNTHTTHTTQQPTHKNACALGATSPRLWRIALALGSLRSRVERHGRGCGPLRFALLLLRLRFRAAFFYSPPGAHPRAFGISRLRLARSARGSNATAAGVLRLPLSRRLLALWRKQQKSACDFSRKRPPK